MRYRNKVYLILSSFSLITAVVIGVVIFANIPRDIETCIYGRVVDANSNLPLDSAKVYITSERYVSDNGYSNYDEFLGKDTVTVITDKNGKFNISLNKSAYVYIKVKKDGYKTYNSEGRYTTNTMKYAISLQNNNEEDLTIHKQ